MAMVEVKEPAGAALSSSLALQPVTAAAAGRAALTANMPVTEEIQIILLNIGVAPVASSASRADKLTYAVQAESRVKRSQALRKSSENSCFAVCSARKAATRLQATYGPRVCWPVGPPLADLAQI
jgi:hypothetical protein